MKKLILALSVSLLSFQASAATILLSGSNFDVSYDSNLLGLYGNPTISGNVIFFTPTLFKAESLNGNGVVTNNGTVNLQIIPKNGFVVNTLNLQEAGDYVLRGANSEVTVTGQTRAFSFSNPFFSVTDPITTTSNLTIRNGLQQNWVATSSLNLSSFGVAPNQAVNYTIENLLTAYTDAADAGRKQAFIEKKFSGFQVTVSPVPEPAAWISMMTGLGMLCLIVSRRKGTI